MQVKNRWNEILNACNILILTLGMTSGFCFLSSSYITTNDEAVIIGDSHYVQPKHIKEKWGFSALREIQVNFL